MSSSAPRVKPSAEEIAAQRKLKSAQKVARKHEAEVKKEASVKKVEGGKKDKVATSQSTHTDSSTHAANTNSQPQQQHQHQQQPAAAANIPASSSSSQSQTPGQPSTSTSARTHRTHTASTTANPLGSPSLSAAPSSATASVPSSVSPPTFHLGNAARVAPPVSAPSSSRPGVQYDNPKKKKKYQKQGMLMREEVKKQVPLFSHLPQYQRETELSMKVGFLTSELPPPIFRLGLQYTNGSITGSNARCVALLTAFHQVIANYHPPANKIIRDDLLQAMKPWVRFLSDCRPHSISMGNAIRFLKLKISKLSPTMPTEAAKEQLCEDITQYIQLRITIADTVIVAAGVARIKDGDVILTYATSHVVERILITAHQEAKRFSVIVVDSRPKLEGKGLLRRLVAAGLHCTYVLLTSVSYVMHRVSVVLLGAFSMLSNGGCVSRVGSAIISMMAHTYCIPVLVCCETYKFSERVQLDSICNNELADPAELHMRAGDNNGNNSNNNHQASVDGELKQLKLLNLVYDLTPVEFVTMVITEVGNVPPTSVPVILREYHKEGDAGADFD